MSKLVTVFGASGNQGLSLVKALVKDSRYVVRAVTRQPDQESGKVLRALGPNVEVCHGDMEDIGDCRNAVRGASTVFLSSYMFHFRHLELDMCKNVLDAMKQFGASPHVVFSGADDAMGEHDIQSFSGHFKVEAEKYMDSLRIPNTKLRTSFYYENLFDRFKPVREKMPGPNEITSWAINFPLEGKPLHMISVKNMGPAVKSIIDNPNEYVGKTIGLTGGLYHMNDIVDAFNKTCAPYTFYDGEETLEDHMRLDYPEFYENYGLFEYYQKMTLKRDLELTRKLNPDTPTFQQWLQDNKAAMMKQLDWEADFPDHFQSTKGKYIEPKLATGLDYWKAYFW